MLLRLAYLGITNTFALLRLLPGSDRDKDIEILSLRHQLAVLQRQLDGQPVRFEPVDRAWLVALLHPLPRPTLRRLRLLVRPDTILRWHRDLLPAVTRRCQGRGDAVGPARCARSGPWFASGEGERQLGVSQDARRATHARDQSCAVDRLGNPARGWHRPAPDRDATTWTDFLRSQADALLAADFIETVTPDRRCR
jgi:putative transposase